ncbi:LppU/SCO3897 family protein [Gordonia humi]|uniref:Uncharacterized protein n=1 Tax=Gordonia humi TaxID=686429 RepID=A0A840EYS3_9ACTN|nr:hypothetical protein [Gordonia humi]MBB4136782.1 hypothetical protein [Gordonia humi]
MTTPPPPGGTGRPEQPNNAGNPFSPNAGDGQYPTYGQQTPQQQPPAQGQTGAQQQPAYGQQQPQGHGQPPQQGYGQPPAYGQPQQGGGQPPTGGYAPIPGTPGYPATPPPGNGTGQTITRAVLGVAALVVVLIVALFVWSPWSKDDGKSVKSTAVGSCIDVTEAEGMNVETKAIECDDTSTVSFIVGAKLADKDACVAAGLSYYVTEYGSAASDDVLCLMPNFRKGECYSESSFSVGLGLETVACTEESTISKTVFKITERVDSKTVPNCTDPEQDQVLAAKIESDPAREIGFCARILGDGAYWQ